MLYYKEFLYSSYRFLRNYEITIPPGGILWILGSGTGILTNLANTKPFSAAFPNPVLHKAPKKR